VRRAENLATFNMPIVLKSGVLNLLETSRPLRACNGIALPFTQIWLSVPKLPLQCAAVSLYSAVKQRLQCNTGKVWDCLIQFLLTVVLSIEERVFVVECVFREGNRYSDLVQKQFADKFPQTPCTSVCRDRPRTLNQLKLQ
jgi:hypothetical protein